MSWPTYPATDPVRGAVVDAAARWALLDPRSPFSSTHEEWTPLPHQVPPPGAWLGWLLLAGRGGGKTDACARWVDQHCRGRSCVAGREPHRVAIVGPTQGDAVEACVTGPSGLMAHNPGVRLHPSSPEGTLVRWPNGARAKLFGAHTPEDVERLRAGGNTCCAWVEEWAAQRYMKDAFDQVTFGLRLGPDPRWVASTTPKPRPLVRRLAPKDLFAYRGEWSVPYAGGVVVCRHATTDDNPHLPAHIRAALEEAYGGTTLGQQELHGRVIDQDDNALWRREALDAGRLRLDPADVRRLLRRLTIGVDPSGGRGEQGIVVAGRYDRRGAETELDVAARRLAEVAADLAGRDPADQFKLALRRGVVLDDRTCTLSPAGWGRRAVQAAVDWEADDLVVEVNYGGDMAVATLRGACEDLGVSVPVRQVRASRGKRVRAEPVAALAERGTWHHAGVFEALEDQLCTWTPEDDDSPDRLDAMVWDAWHTGLVTTVSGGGGRLPDPGQVTAADARGRRPARPDPRTASPWR